jgi:hypothetical protein
LTDVKGLQIIANIVAFNQPIKSPIVVKVGTELNNDKIKFKFLANLRTLVIENQCTYKPASYVVGGYNVEIDAKA